MVKKAEAIHLAEMIEEDMSCIGDGEIAKELRRLHDVNQELLEALQYLMVASGKQLTSAFEQAQEVIAKVTGKE